MNVENLKKTREAVAASESYDQRRFAHPCGTPACIAGHAAIAAGATLRTGRDEMFWADQDDQRVRIESLARRFLELDPDESFLMFDPSPLGRPPATREEALRMLDHAIETGEVWWERPK